MGIASSLSSGLPARHRHRLSRCRSFVLPVPFLLVWLGAQAFVPHEAPGQQFRQAPMFEGKMIPDPPSQGQPWTAPATKLPRFLVTATEILFEQGVADPRGCEYRQVEIGDEMIVKVHGFVLPERADLAGRFVVCWDGLVYPALTVGAPADLDHDMNDLAAEFKKSRENRKGARESWSAFWDTADEGPHDRSTTGVDSRSPIKLCLLLRLGRADLAEALFAAATAWTPEARGLDFSRYGVSYLTLATDWACSAFLRLIGAHVRGEDVIALDSARRLARFRDLAIGQCRRDGLPAEQSTEPRWRRPRAQVSLPDPARRAAPRPGAACQDAPAHADSQEGGRPHGQDRGPDPRPRPDRRAAGDDGRRQSRPRAPGTRFDP